MLLLQGMRQKVCSISAKVWKFHYSSHGGTLHGEGRVYFPRLVNFKCSFLLGCVEREGLLPSIRGGTRWSCEKGEGEMLHFVGRLLESGSIFRGNIFFSANIISNGFSGYCWFRVWKSREFPKNSLLWFIHLEGDECQISCRTILPSLTFFFSFSFVLYSF